MSTCVECSKYFSASVWSKIFGDSDICPECKQDKKKRIRQYADKVKEYGADNYLDGQEEESLTKLQSTLNLTDDDLKSAQRQLRNLRKITKQADIEMYEEKLREVGEDSYLDTEEETELAQLVSQLGLTDQDISHTVGTLIGLKRLTALQDGNLPVLEADILLRKNEVCHYEIPASLMEQKSKTRYVGGSQGVSIRIAKGVRYRVGAFKGERVVDTVLVQRELE